MTTTNIERPKYMSGSHDSRIRDVAAFNRVIKELNKRKVNISLIEQLQKERDNILKDWPTIENVQALYEMGFRQRAIAEKLGCSQPTIHRAIRVLWGKSYPSNHPSAEGVKWLNTLKSNVEE